MTREEMIDRMVARDIESIIHWDEDHWFLKSVLYGDCWVPYNQLTDEQVIAEYNEREF